VLSRVVIRARCAILPFALAAAGSGVAVARRLDVSQLNSTLRCWSGPCPSSSATGKSTRYRQAAYVDLTRKERTTIREPGVRQSGAPVPKPRRLRSRWTRNAGEKWTPFPCTWCVAGSPRRTLRYCGVGVAEHAAGTSLSNDRRLLRFTTQTVVRSLDVLRRLTA